MGLVIRALGVTILALLACAPGTAAAQQSSHLTSFGYFAARLTPSGGNHLAEVADRSNLNWVQISDVDRYRPEVLDGCLPAGCIVSTGNEFFTGCDKAGSTTCNLYPNYRDRWLRLAREIGPRIGKVGAFYLLDEPQWRGASAAEVATAARTIKQTFPSIPVMMIEAGPKVTASLQVPAEVDWAGFDWYCQPFSAIRSKLAILEGRTAARQGLFLMPEAAPLKECGGKPGHRTDAEIAALQWDYFNLAESRPRVIGLLAFGFWTSGYGSAQLPRTVAAHRQIAARIIRRPTAPPPPATAPPNAAPAITRLKVAKRIRRTRAHPRRTKRRKSTTISFRLSEPATVTLSFARQRAGRAARRKGRRTCVRPTRRNRRARRCRRYVPAKGTVRIAGQAGTNRIVFHGRLSKRRSLRRGTYRLTLRARDAAGAQSRRRHARFRLVR